MRSYWVTKEYQTSRGTMFFHVGVSETSMLNALLNNVQHPRSNLQINEHREDYWTAVPQAGRDGVTFHVHRSIPRPELGELYSVRDLRMDSTKREPYKPMPAKIQFKTPAQLELL